VPIDVNTIVPIIILRVLYDNILILIYWYNFVCYVFFDFCDNYVLTLLLKRVKKKPPAVPKPAATIDLVDSEEEDNDSHQPSRFQRICRSLKNIKERRIEKKEKKKGS
jgi:hypothetical protein